MALVPKSVPSSSFENPDADTATAVVDAPTPQPIAQAAATTAVAIQRPANTAVATQRTSANPFADMRDAYVVDYNTLAQLMATNGNFMDKESGAMLGDSIDLQLMSFQDNFAISPGVDTDEAKKLVRYSSDGVHTKNGENCMEYLKSLKDAGYVKASMSKRVILVGALVNPGKIAAMKDSLVQIDLAPSSKSLYDRYTIQSAYDVGRGKVTKEQASLLRLTAKVTKNASNQVFTQVTFESAPVAA
jgi:hypothetical protein